MKKFLLPAFLLLSLAAAQDIDPWVVCETSASIYNEVMPRYTHTVEAAALVPVENITEAANTFLQGVTYSSSSDVFQEPYTGGLIRIFKYYDFSDDVLLIVAYPDNQGSAIMCKIDADADEPGVKG